MTKNTPATTSPERGWVVEVAEIWNQLAQGPNKPKTAELAQALAARFKITTSTADALIAGFQSLVSYGCSEQAVEVSAIEEERLSVQAALRAVRPVLEARLQHLLDEADLKQEEVKCLACGHKANSQGRRQRNWQSTVGKLQLVRRYLWCQPCEQGLAPAQQVVCLPSSDYTAGLEEVTTLMATTVPHQMAADLVEKLLGLEVSPQAIKSSVERRAEALIKFDDGQADEIQQYQKQWEKTPPYITQQAPERPIEVAYLELDGVHVLAREQIETAQQVSKGRGGPGRKYAVGGREVKNAVLYEATACASESQRRGCILEKSYVSHLGDWMGLARLLWVMMLRRGFNRAKLLVVLSDGAESIRSLCNWLPVPVFLILDLYHVKHKIWQMAAAIYGERSEAAKTWACQQCQRIEEGGASEVIEGLEFLKRSHRKAREQIESLQTYLRNNQDRMDYARYREMGLRVGSGAVESANYHVTGARLKLPGMRWSEEGATQMARLRADLFNGVWQERSKQILKAA